MFLQSKERIPYSQWVTGFGVTMLLIQVGFIDGWPSPTLAKLSAPDSVIPINFDQASWIVSVKDIGNLFGAILIGPALVNYWGSRRAIIITLFPMFFGWLTIALADAVEWLYAARLFNGLGLGVAFSVFPLYIGEVSIPEIRGALMSLVSIGLPFGQVVASICGAYLSISAASSLYLALILPIMGLFFYLPESPHHLIKVGEREAAKKSIDWYRGGRGVDLELAAVEKLISAYSKESFADKLAEFKRPATRKAIFKIIILFCLKAMCGINLIMYFMETILERVHFNLVRPSLAVIYINISCIFATMLSMFFIDRYGRRILLAIAGLGSAISMFGLMSHFLLMNSNVALQWLPVSSILLYMIFYFGGFLIVPSTVLGELFPSNIKCIVSGMVNAVIAPAYVLSTKTYQPLADRIGEAYVYLIYAIICTITVPYALFVLPETNGKTLQQIQDEMDNHST